MRIYQDNITADDTDILNGTDLDQLEGEGQLDLYFKSSQADGVMTITPPGVEAPARGILIAFDTTGIKVSDDVPYSLYLRNGGHVICNYDEVTNATLQFLAIWRKRGVDF